MDVQVTATASANYEFRKDFDGVARPGLHRYLEECPPDEGERWETAQVYIKELWRALKGIQQDCREFGYSVELAIYHIEGWSRESAAAYVERRLEDIIDSCKRHYTPLGVDFYLQSTSYQFDDEGRRLIDSVGGFEVAYRIAERLIAFGAKPIDIECAVHAFLKGTMHAFTKAH